MEIIEITNKRYLSEVIDCLPSHCLINKGVTGCGGTTLELQSCRNSIILCPTRNLVTSKASDKYLGVTGDTSNNDILHYIKSDIPYKKIVATYDALKRLMDIIPDIQSYFLLIDEYHLLFNDYSFRTDTILFILNNFKSFKDWAFMTATPIKQEFILKELQGIPTIQYKWKNSVPVNITIKDTHFIQKELLNMIESLKDRNLHIFLNSLSTIYKITEKISEDYRVVCSETSKTKIKNFEKINSPVKRINFYTSCAFEGCDIYDANGYCIIVSDTNISTTVLDISTKIRQICGRIRNSNYQDRVTIILNTGRHRYAGTTEESFLKHVQDSEYKGRNWNRLFNIGTDEDKETYLASYHKDTFSTLYVSKYNNKLFYDENLKAMDIYNYKLISEIYNSSITVLTECTKNNFNPLIIKPDKGLQWIKDKLIELNQYEFTYEELNKIFEPLFLKHNIKWNKNTSIIKFFPEHTKKRKMKNGVKNTYYIFK